MKFLPILIVLMCTAGCATPLSEINYRGSLKFAQVDPFEVAEKFANGLERETDLKIEDRTKKSGSPRLDASASIHLRTKRSSGVWVIVIAYAEDRSIVARVAGDIDSPLAKELADACVRVYSKLYPGSEFVQFQRNRGLFGP